MDRNEFLTRGRATTARLARGACAVLSGVAALALAAMVAGIVLWAAYAASFAYLGDVVNREHADIGVDAGGARLEPRGAVSSPKRCTR